MSVNITLFGEFIAFFILLLVPIFAFIRYKLGKRKSTNPGVIAFVGGCLSLILPLGLIFIAILALKKDLPKKAQFAR
ncbi:MAG: hypothetical protein ACTH36_02680 [Pseudoalteromonas nigrifaciens]